MVDAPPVTPSAAYATGFATVAASAWVLTTTATGWFEVTVTTYCLLSVRPGAPRLKSLEFGSIGFARPASIVRPIVTGEPEPSNVRNVACTEATPVPMFWMMNGVTKRPKRRRVMFGRYTVFAPAVKPLYESASARLPVPWCSLTTPTTVEPKLFTTTANWPSTGSVGFLLVSRGSFAYDVPGSRFATMERATHVPSLNV